MTSPALPSFENLRHLRQVASNFVAACDGLLALTTMSAAPPPATPTLPPAASELSEEEAELPQATRSGRGRPRKVKAAAGGGGNSRELKKPRKSKALPAVKLEPAAAAALGPLQGEIIELLRASQPLTSREIFERLTKKGVSTTIDSVYQTCGAVKGKGLIETRVSEADGQRRWHLLVTKQEATAGK